MPITLADIANKHTTVTRHFERGSLTITYDPNVITEEVFVQLQALGTSEVESVFESFRTFNELLVSIITDWDLLENDGSTVPLTVERLKRLPVPIRVLAINMIMGDIRPEVMAPQGAS